MGSCRKSGSRATASSREAADSRVERYTSCWPTRFTSARSATSRSAIPGSTNRFFLSNFGREYSGSSMSRRRLAGEAQTGPLPVPLRESFSTPMVSHSTCREPPRTGGATATTYSKRLVNSAARDNAKGWRLSAPELERAVAIATWHILSDLAGLLEALEKSGLNSPDVRGTLESASNFVRRVQDEADATASFVEIISKVELRSDGIAVTLGIEVPCSRAGVRTSGILKLPQLMPLGLKRRGVETRIVIAAGDNLPRKLDPALLRAAARSRAWFEELASGRVRSSAEIASRENVTRRYVERLSRLSFVEPESSRRSPKGASLRTLPP